MVCTNCGATNAETLYACLHCGHKLSQSSPVPPAVTPGPSGTAAAPAPSDRTQLETGVLSPPPDSSQFATQAIPPIAHPASSSALQPGALFASRYRIESLLGQGGMGAVYKARDIELDRTVALKLVRPELASSPQTMERFKQELLLASKISHKNILRIYDLGDADGVKFITMAFVEGADLATAHRADRASSLGSSPELH